MKTNPPLTERLREAAGWSRPPLWLNAAFVYVSGPGCLPFWVCFLFTGPPRCSSNPKTPHGACSACLSIHAMQPSRTIGQMPPRWGWGRVPVNGTLRSAWCFGPEHPARSLFGSGPTAVHEHKGLPDLTGVGGGMIDTGHQLFFSTGKQALYLPVS